MCVYMSLCTYIYIYVYMCACVSVCVYVFVYVHTCIHACVCFCARACVSGSGGTHRYSKSLHWPSHSGSAFTFVESMALPRNARACGPRPPRNNGQTWIRTRESIESHHACTHRRSHARDRHTDAFGTVIVP